MEDEVLTAVTAPLVAPLSSRLSVADFQRLPEVPPSSSDLQWQPLPLPQVEVTIAGSPFTETAGVNLGFEAEFSSPRLRKLGGCVPSLVSQPIANNGVGPAPAPPTTFEFDQSLGKWCLKNLTGSKSFDHQLEPSVIEAGLGGQGVWRGRGRVKRDSVGTSASSSPSSSLTSPRRWAAKAEELRQTEEPEPTIFPAAAPASGHGNRIPASCPRSCSADHLGAIVDILGVPSGAPQFWENPKRLILSAEKRKIEMKRYVIRL